MQRFREIAPGVLVATSQLLTCTSTAVLADDGGCLVIDPAVSAADLAALAADLDGAGLRARIGFATHPHRDHVLWSRDLGDVARYAAPRAVAAAEAEREAMVSEAEFRRRLDADAHYLDLLSAGEPFDDPAAR